MRAAKVKILIKNRVREARIAQTVDWKHNVKLTLFLSNYQFLLKSFS